MKRYGFFFSFSVLNRAWWIVSGSSLRYQETFFYKLRIFPQNVQNCATTNRSPFELFLAWLDIKYIYLVWSKNGPPLRISLHFGLLIAEEAQRTPLQFLGTMRFFSRRINSSSEIEISVTWKFTSHTIWTFSGAPTATRFCLLPCRKRESFMVIWVNFLKNCWCPLLPQAAACDCKNYTIGQGNQSVLPDTLHVI